MITGKLQRRWQEEMPQVFNKETRIVCLDIKEETQTVQNGEESTEVSGYSFIPVEIDSQIDYGHIKSQLIEAGFAQKDEFDLLMNAVDGVITAALESTSWAKFKEALSAEAVATFVEFNEFRAMCADAAKGGMKAY